mgnify:FL=1
MESKHTVWFLGSNSEHGFHSLYDGFCAGDGDFLRVIKGGPGTGKSSFMRAIGLAAEAAGHDVEYIICSGDPDSLDGIYIPDLHVGYADGTAPHVMDPSVFGGTGDYLNIGGHCAVGGTYAHIDELQEFTDGYRAMYKRAYELLAAAAKVSPSLTMAYAGEEAVAAVRARAAGVASRELPHERSSARGRITRRFLGGLTCRGRILLADTLSGAAPRLFLLDNRLGLGFEFTSELARQAYARGLDAVICPHWLDPSRVEAVIFPSLGLAWAVIDPLAKYPEQHRCLHLDRMAGSEALNSVRSQLKEDEKLEERLLTRAGQCLAGAKALHDRLEAVYRPFVDFEGLDAAVESEKRRLGL